MMRTPSIAWRFVASGTVYAPTAGVDMTMYGLDTPDTPILRRGLIASSIKLGLKPNLGPCGLNDSTTLTDLNVTYQVGLAPPSMTATAKLDGITLEVLSGPLVRAEVTFDRAKATVKEWSVLR